MKIKDTLIVLFIVGAMSLVANAIGTKYTIVEAISRSAIFNIFGNCRCCSGKIFAGTYPCCCLYRNFGLYPDLSDYAR